MKRFLLGLIPVTLCFNVFAAPPAEPPGKPNMPVSIKDPLPLPVTVENPTQSVEATIVNQPLQVENVNESVEELYQQNVSLNWNEFDGRTVTRTFPVDDDLGNDVGVPDGKILELAYVNLRVNDNNVPPIENVTCSLSVGPGNTGRNLNFARLHIPMTEVPNSTGLYITSQPITLYEFGQSNPTLTCTAASAPTFTITVSASIIGRFLTDTR